MLTYSSRFETVIRERACAQICTLCGFHVAIGLAALARGYAHDELRWSRMTAASFRLRATVGIRPCPERVVEPRTRLVLGC
jgi:hypothetical protein